MKLERIAFAAALFFVAGVAIPSAHAQVTESKPVTVKIKTVKPPKSHLDTFKGVVLHMDAQSIMVRDANNTAVVKTFSYTPELSKKLKSLIDRGGYQYGDRVRVKYKSGETVAQNISGKASKPR